MRTIIRATEARYQVGRVTQQDVFKALLEQSEVMNQLICRRSREQRRAGETEQRHVSAASSAVQLPVDLAAPSADLSLPAIEDLALTNRPQLKGAEEEIVRSERMYELAERNRKFPDFMVGWDYVRMPTENEERPLWCHGQHHDSFLALDDR